MKTFFSVLSALLVAMAIGYAFYDHLQWAQKRDAGVAEINSCLGHMSDMRGSKSEEALGELREQSQRIHDARTAMTVIFAEKTLPLSADEKRFESANRSALNDEWLHIRDEDLQAIELADRDASETIGDNPAKRDAREFQVMVRERFIRDTDKNAPFSDPDKPRAARLKSDIPSLQRLK